MATELTVKFDYSLVTDDIKSKLVWFEGEIKKASSGHVKWGMEVGKYLSQAQELMPTQGAFQSWVETRCGYSIRSAYNYMSAFKEFGTCANLQNLELSAMYALTQNEEAKKKALKLADRGVQVTHKMAKDLVKNAGGPEKPGGGGRGPGKGSQEPERIDPVQQAKNNAKVAKDLIDRAVRAVDDLHAVKPNLPMRDRIVAALQKCGKAVW